MVPDDKDMARLWDMLDAARAGVEFTRGRAFEDLLGDRMLRSAVERTLEVIGEAAGRVSVETRAALPGIPWRSVIGLRNVLAHEYGEIRYEVLWKVCRDELPTLIRQLVAIGADNVPPEERQ